MKFLVRELGTGIIRDRVTGSDARMFFLYKTPPDWPLCERLLVPDDYQEGNPFPEDSMEHYFILHNREGAIASVHVARTQTDFDGFRAGTHYAFGWKKRPVTLEEAEAIAFDGPEAWLVNPESGALRKKV